MLIYVTDRMVGRKVNRRLFSENKDCCIVPPGLKNHNLMYSDPDDSVPLSLEEWEDSAADEGAANGWKLAARYSADIPLSLWERGQG